MGAEFQTTTLRCTKGGLKSAFDALVRQEQHENGHGGYTGSFAEAPGVDIHDSRTFTSMREAEEYIDAHAKKWENAIAVPVQTVGRAERDVALSKSKPYQKAYAAWKKAEEKSVTLARDVQAAKAAMVKSIREGKTTFVTCSNCKSKLARAHLKDGYCPLCRVDGTLATKSAVTKIQKMIVKYQAAAAVTSAAEQKVYAARTVVETAVATKGGETVWLVGGVFSS